MRLCTFSHACTWEASRRTRALGLLLVCTLAAVGTQPQWAVAQTFTAPVQFEPAHLADQDGNRPTDPSTPLYDFRSEPGTLPITAVDGHHITLGEWQAVNGQAQLAATPDGTQLTLDLAGLVPNGVYTAWSSYFSDPPHIIPAAEAHGSAGTNDGSESSFVADENGTATYTVMLPPGPMSIRGVAPDSMFGDYEAYQVAAVYHIDGQMNGPVPGPNSVGALFANFTAIPEPSSIVLALLAVGGFAAIARRVRR